MAAGSRPTERDIETGQTIEYTRWHKIVEKFLHLLFPFIRLSEEHFSELRSDFQDGYIEYPGDKYNTIKPTYVLTYALFVWLLRGMTMKLTTESEEINVQPITDLPYCLIELDMEQLTPKHPLTEDILKDFGNRNIQGTCFLFHVTNATVTRLRKENDKLYEHFTHRRYNNYGDHEHNMPKLLFMALKEELAGVRYLVGEEISYKPHQASVQVFSMGTFTLMYFRFCQGAALMTSLVLTAIAGILPVWDENKQIKIASVVLAGCGGALAIIQFITTRSFELTYGIDPKAALADNPIFVRTDLGVMPGETVRSWKAEQVRLLKFLVIHQVYTVKGRAYCVFRALNASGPVSASCNLGVTPYALMNALPTFFSDKGSRKLAALPDPYSERYWEAGKSHIHSNTVNSASASLYHHSQFRLIR
ncbi:hypothetical protein E3Q18_01101 [Wallemia mellicola]|uniref:Uncharacterized protein n=1 Tax=Wallemia mellicola TaxID=1708541 RepID=A0A4T0TBI4_9BASI|nr:hypothetical protein E3Q23_03272 [Wallemia mellicola]TIC00626.1 hypothetical protein E3Q18_01101 [Wallemia mellicola]TIC62459.1 hypothetical protein E3Q01_03926 [Wallemia mellicola]